VEEEIRILCVDDEQNVLNAITRLLLDENYGILRSSVCAVCALEYSTAYHFAL